MGKKHNPDTSQLPSDDFTWTEGDSFGLDTFLHDMDKAEGVQQGARLPQTKGLSRLPGVDPVEESKFSQSPMGTSVLTHGPGKRYADLGENRLDGIRGLLASHDSDERLPALDWLEMESDLEKQDPERLPKNPVDLAVEELEEAWGVNRRTDGQVILRENSRLAGDFRLDETPVDLDRARYENSLDGVEERRRFSASDLRAVVAEALRRSAAGEPIRDILLNTARILEDEAPRVKKAMQAMVEEHGLAGKVHVRASAYPGCHNGEWTDLVNKKSKSARYVVKASKCDGCVHNDCGSCQMFQRRLVASVPWEEARDVYRPRIEADGIKLASKGNPREALRKAFASKAPRKALDTNFPEENPGGHVRMDEKLRSARNEESFEAIREVRARQQNNRRAKLATYLGKLKSAGLLTAKQAKSILRKGGDMEDIKAQISAIIARRDMKSSSHDTGERAEYIGQQKNPRPRQLTAHQKAVRKVAKQAGVKPSEVNGMLQWVKEEINTGWTGEELTGLLYARFERPLLKAASGMIRDLRSQHEGLAGHLYIDAETYGGKRGVKGCEDGALKHRANDIPYVLRMASCGSCVHCNQHGRCNKYGKELVTPDDFEPGELERYQRESVRYADAPDAEKTASIFAPVEDPASEWGLRNDALENIQYFEEEEEPDAIGDLGSVVFGGMDLPDSWGE